LQKPSLEDLRDRVHAMPNTRRRTVVFDLDETLIHCNENDDAPCDVLIDIDLGDGEPIKASVNIRPYCYQMLQVLQEHFELVVFTASHQSYADKVLDHIDPKRTIFSHRFFRDSCFQIDENLFIKDLRVLANRNLDVDLVDALLLKEHPHRR
jgi:CTD small phosphatase-like protein 2